MRIVEAIKRKGIVTFDVQLAMIVETADPERIWNGFRLANTALAADHTVEVFLLGDGVETPDVETPDYNPRGVVRKFVADGGTLYACGTCLDARELEESDLRPRASMEDLLQVVERADKVVSVG